MTKEAESQLLSLDQVLTDWLPISRSKLHQEVRAGRLTITRLGRRAFIARRDLEAYIHSLPSSTSSTQSPHGEERHEPAKETQ